MDRPRLQALDAELRSLNKADPRAALELAARWLAESEVGGESEAWALRGRAHARRALGEYAAALDDYERAERCFQRLGLPSEAARTGAGHVWTLRLVGRYDEALALALRTRRYFRARGEVLEAAKQTNNLGTVYRLQGRLQAARRAYLEAARDARRAGDPTEEATATSNLGNILADLGRYGEAEWAQRRAIRIYTQLNQSVQLARARLNLGTLLKRRGDLGRALLTFQSARALYEQLGLSSGVALVDLGLARTYLALNLHAEAAEASQRAAAGFAALDRPFDLGQSLLCSAAAAERRGDEAELRRCLDAAVGLFEQAGNRLAEAVASVQAARVMPPEPESLARLAAAQRRLASLGAQDSVIEATLVQGELLARLGQRRRALGRYRSARQAAERIGDDQLSYRSEAALGRMLERTAPGRALGHYRAAVEHLEALRRRARSDDLKLTVVADKLDVYERSAALLVRRRGRVDEALAMVERGKSLGLLEDVLLQAEHGGREAASLARRVRDLRARLGETYARRDSTPGEPEPRQAEALASLEREAAAASRQLQLMLRGEAAVAPFDLGQVRAALASDRVLLEYYLLGEELVCFVLDQEQLSLRRGLGSVSQLQHLAERVRFHLGKAVYGADYLEANLPRLRLGLDRVLGELWQVCVAPLERELRRARGLVVVPHGPLHGLPLHAAFSGDGYLAERWTVSYAPSARVYAACAERPVAPPRRPLFVGLNDESLPGVVEEVTALTRLFPGGESLAGGRATRAALRRRAGRFDLLHLATHALFRADNPSYSALKLTDGWLSVADLAELSRGASLVTLSACDTGRSALAAGEELVGLTRAVLGAGTASLLASLWSVHDAATSRFMTAFYRALLGGESKAEALHSAMWAVRRDLDHPFFWAPFALAGAG